MPDIYLGSYYEPQRDGLENLLILDRLTVGAGVTAYFVLNTNYVAAPLNNHRYFKFIIEEIFRNIERVRKGHESSGYEVAKLTGLRDSSSIILDLRNFRLSDLEQRVAVETTLGMGKQTLQGNTFDPVFYIGPEDGVTVIQFSSRQALNPTDARYMLLHPFIPRRFWSIVDECLRNQGDYRFKLGAHNPESASNEIIFSPGEYHVQLSNPISRRYSPSEQLQDKKEVSFVFNYHYPPRGNEFPLVSAIVTYHTFEDYFEIDFKISFRENLTTFEDGLKKRFGMTTKEAEGRVIYHHHSVLKIGGTDISYTRFVGFMKEMLGRIQDVNKGNQLVETAAKRTRGLYDMMNLDGAGS